MLHRFGDVFDHLIILKSLGGKRLQCQEGVEEAWEAGYVILPQQLQSPLWANCRLQAVTESRQDYNPNDPDLPFLQWSSWWLS